ncbi:MAG: ribonuclease III [Cytophagales bacterium]
MFVDCQKGLIDYTLFDWLIKLFQDKKLKSQRLREALKSIIGVEPKMISLYLLAIKHTSVSKENKIGIRESNERLEFLGDAVLDLIVGEYIFKKFPAKDEGFLTEIRSRIVNAESLSSLSKKMGIDKLVEIEKPKNSHQSFRYVYGDALEALVGAIYLDLGFKACQNFIEKRMLDEHLDLSQVVETNLNYKSKLIEWAHKTTKLVNFQIVGEKGQGNLKVFEAVVQIEGEIVSKGEGYSKKKAEQDAAQKAWVSMNLSSTHKINNEREIS